MFIKIVDSNAEQSHLYEGKKVRWQQCELETNLPAHVEGSGEIGLWTSNPMVGLQVIIDEKECLRIVNCSVFFMADSGKTIDRWSPPVYAMAAEK